MQLRTWLNTSLSTTPKVSVVMPVHNGATFLCEAVESILLQTFNDFEFIIVDDGSIDETGSILADYQCRDPRIRVHSHERRGHSASINTALELARGEYAARMDADDVSMPTRLAAQVAFMDAHREVGVCGTWIRTFGIPGGRVVRYATEDAVLRSQLLFGNPIAHPSLILRRRVFTEAGLLYQIGRFADDYEMWMRASRRCHLANIPRVLLHYRLHSSQVSRRQFDEQMDEAKSLRLSQLALLNVVPTQEEAELHETVSNLQLAVEFQPSIELLDRAEAWLRHLQAANQTARAFPEPAFSSTLSRQWYKVCSASVSLGWPMWLWARRSEFGRRDPQRFGNVIKLAVKCGLGRRWLRAA